MRERLALVPTLQTDGRARSTSVVTLTAGIAFITACSAPKQHTAKDHVHECRPGASVSRCMTLQTEKGASDRFPAGRLDGINVELDRVVKEVPASGRVGDIVYLEGQRVFVHRLIHEYGHADVCAVLRSELGEPQGHAKAGDFESLSKLPLQPRRQFSIPGDFWKTQEGFWMCSDAPFTNVYWASNPFSIEPQDEHIDRNDRGVDRYVREAPRAARLWEKLAQTLIGTTAEK